MKKLLLTSVFILCGFFCSAQSALLEKAEKDLKEGKNRPYKIWLIENSITPTKECGYVINYPKSWISLQPDNKLKHNPFGHNECVMFTSASKRSPNSGIEYFASEDNQRRYVENGFSPCEFIGGEMFETNTGEKAVVMLIFRTNHNSYTALFVTYLDDLKISSSMVVQYKKKDSIEQTNKILARYIEIGKEVFKDLKKVK